MRAWLRENWKFVAVFLITIGFSIWLFVVIEANRPVLYAVSFSEDPAKISLPANYVAHFWIEDGEPWMAITLSEYILDEWCLELGYHEGDVNGWKEAWRFWIDEFEFQGSYCRVQFRFKDVHYA